MNGKIRIFRRLDIANVFLNDVGEGNYGTI